MFEKKGLKKRKRFEKAKHEQSLKYTFILAPNSSGRTIKFSIPGFIVKNAAFILLMLVFVFIFLVGSYIHLLISYNSSKEDLITLQSINKDQQVQLYQMNELVEQIDDKIYYLDLLEKKIKNLMGTDGSAKSDSNIDKALVKLEKEMGNGTLSVGGDGTDSGQGYYVFSNDIADFDKSDEINSLKKQLSSLNTSLEEEQTNYSELQSDVETHSDFALSYPDYWPTDTTYISSYFGYRTLPYVGFHSGLDLADGTGSAIYAAAKGKVTYSGWSGGYGYVINIDHGYGYVTVYGHNSKLLVKEGDYVTKGQKIALMGSTGYSTGPHCHFEVRENGTAKNPLNYIKKRKK